ncbi:MAG: RdgB/HAM1 family non-canonical purine NTP pyrophosphatase [Clostridiales Family XIII bacterium]|jgi:XTP/dITP diphosphohydrolase|nr:RdgB/HAM1 family non-canonical purine NTP pyrophosphatase [Clostridiales Family XIII bacterium]
MDILVAATGNRHKIQEIDAVTRNLGIRVQSPEEAGFVLRDVEENGKSFSENARIKAEAFAKDSGVATIADDSGLVVDALDGAPGIYSARFSGPDATDETNLAKVLQWMENIPDTERKARFVCAICVIFPDGSEIAVEGECHGRILRAPIGENGFGYDPIFVPVEYDAEGLSFGQIPAEEKNLISHRARALIELEKKLKGRQHP